MLPAARVGTRLVGLRFENSPSRAGRRTSRLRAHCDACHGRLRCENFSSPRERSEHETCERTMFKFDGSHRRASPASASHTVESLWEVIHISDVKGMIFPYDRALTLARNIAQNASGRYLQPSRRWLRARIGRVVPGHKRFSPLPGDDGADTHRLLGETFVFRPCPSSCAQVSSDGHCAVLNSRGLVCVGRMSRSYSRGRTRLPQEPHVPRNARPRSRVVRSSQA
jgi:hypothetical protein